MHLGRGECGQWGACVHLPAHHPPPPRSLKQALRILLECFLVFSHIKPMFHYLFSALVLNVCLLLLSELLTWNTVGEGSRHNGSVVCSNNWLSSWNLSSSVQRCPSFVRLLMSHSNVWKSVQRCCSSQSDFDHNFLNSNDNFIHLFYCNLEDLPDGPITLTKTDIDARVHTVRPR